jgi:hypothetical protein
MLGQGVYMPIPLLAIGTQPIVDLRKRFGIQRVDAALSVHSDTHKTAFPECPKVFGDQRL